MLGAAKENKKGEGEKPHEKKLGITIQTMQNFKELRL